jgi:transposase
VARKILENKSKREARRCHKRQLANVIIRHMWNDAERHTQTATADRMAAA